MAKTAIRSKSPGASKTGSSRAKIIPLDNEPLTPSDLRRLRVSEAAFRSGNYVTLEELKSDVAPLRSKGDRAGTKP